MFCPFGQRSIKRNAFDPVWGEDSILTIFFFKVIPTASHFQEARQGSGRWCGQVFHMEILGRIIWDGQGGMGCREAPKKKPVS
jgi:hypothetical protein